MITVPLKCKLCNRTISPPTRIIGQSEAEYRGSLTAKLMGHVAGHAKEEGKTGGPHAQGNAEAAIRAQNLYAALLMGCFEITPEMEQDRSRVFAMIHQLTRTVKVTDEELQSIARAEISQIEDPDGFSDGMVNVLQDLRDRYEGLGKYAPKPAETNAPAAQEVGKE